MDLELRHRLPMVGRRFYTELEQRIAIDTRSLAAFRILMGVLLVVDMILRSGKFSYFYTESGVMPLEEAVLHTPDNAFSLYYLTTDPTIIAVLFLIQALVGIQLIVGYKTKVATILAFIFVVSLQHRNMYVLSYADTLYLLLLFWAIFLPLGERWSIDSLHRLRLPRQQVSSFASTLILLQMVSMYIINQFHKSQSEFWLNGDATTIILGTTEITHFLGPYMGHFPTALEIGTYFWYYLLLASVFLIVFTERKRTMMIGLFIMGHTVFALTVRIGSFPYVSYAGLLLFLQASFWDDLQQIGNYRERVSATLTSLKKATEQRAKKLPYYRAENQTLHRIKSAVGTVAITVIILSLLIGVSGVFLVASGVTDESPAPQQIGETAKSIGLFNPAWDIFAPNVRSHDRYYIIAAETTQGDKIELYNSNNLSADRPYDQLQKQHDTYRDRFYMRAIAVNTEGDETLTGSTLQQSFARHYCNSWSEENDGELSHINFHYVDEQITTETVLNPEDRETEQIEVFRYGCGNNQPDKIEGSYRTQ